MLHIAETVGRGRQASRFAFFFPQVVRRHACSCH